MEYGLIGEHLSHSFSKEIHNAFADYDYKIKELKKEEVEDFLLKKDFKGINVTIPYKEAVIPYLDEISEEAVKIGAVNTIVNNNGKLFGYNTDYFGLKRLIEKSGIEIKNKNVLILGTGGTSKTSFAVVTDMGAKSVVKVSRNPKGNEISYENAAKTKETNIIINTTPCGMFPKYGCIALSPKHFSKLSGVIEAIYNPLNTEFLMTAQDMNIKNTNGLYMLVSQAVKSSELFLNTKYPDNTTEETYKKILSQKRNIVLIGMPGCGKTTIGKNLAKISGKKFIDTDELIKKETNMSPAEIIIKFGEAYFRKVESEIIKQISTGNGTIIATGGGSILKEENIKNLKRNGVLIFIERQLELTEASGDRPLSKSKEALQNLYNERIDIYNSVCDIKIINDETIYNAVGQIRKELL